LCGESPDTQSGLRWIQKRAAQAFIGLVLLGAGVLIYTFGTRPGSVAPSDSKAHSAEPPQIIASAQTPSPVPSVSAPIKLTPAESEERDRRLAKAEEAFQDIENTQAKFVAEIAEPNGLSVYFRIPTPTDEIYQRYSTALSRALEGASDRLISAGIARQAALFDEYVQCSTPYKLIQGFLSKARSRYLGWPKLRSQRRGSRRKCRWIHNDIKCDRRPWLP